MFLVVDGEIYIPSEPDCTYDERDLWDDIPVESFERDPYWDDDLLDF
jgi:hypothetical protein